MKEKILVVEDEFIVANDLKLMLNKAGHDVCGIASTVAIAREMIQKHQPTWVMLDIVLKDQSLGTELALDLIRQNIGFIYISANTNQSILEVAKQTQPYGFVMKPFREKDLLMMFDIARNKHQEKKRLSSEQQKTLQHHFHEINNAQGERMGKFQMLPLAFQGFIPFEFMKINLKAPSEGAPAEYGFFRTGFNKYNMLLGQELLAETGVTQQEMRRYPISQPPLDQTGFQNNNEFRRALLDDIRESRISKHYQILSRLTFCFKFGNNKLAAISFYSQNAEGYNISHLNFLDFIKNELQTIFESAQKESNALSDANANKSTKHLNTPLSEEPTIFEGIIGTSASLIKVLDDVTLVASAPVSVLVLGESGTGKELVAKAIHNRSPRRLKPLITVNCAALPSELIESELFGYEKGAFTGATERRAGKFEAANGGTIFLDEIGELSLEAQVKLLRVLQEQEFEPVGSTKTIKVDVRLIAATNRNLEKEVAEGRLRLDIYYRLNVFPINLPPLRERKDDIPYLVRHFVDKYAKKFGRPITGVDSEVLVKLCNYQWPGNIRELEHLIERSILIARGSVIENIDLPVEEAKESATAHTNPALKEIKTLEQIEAEHIIDVLRKCKGKINGPGGAAEILGLPASTLNSKLKKLGLKKDFS